MTSRDRFYLRGRLVRILAETSGCYRVDACFNVMCDIAEFNRENPTIAIPPAAAILGHTLLTICGECMGEGSREALDIERTCGRCAGSGFRDIAGFGRGHQVRSA